jgi:predicted transcriptional regulator
VVSKGLKKPKVTISDYKISKAGVEKIVEHRTDARQHFEKLYQGYMFNDMTVKTSEYVSGKYVYIRMRKPTSWRK